MQIRKTKGLIAAPFTPFDDQGDLNLEAIKDYAGHVKKNGVAGVFICGTTGEGLLMTTAERKLLAEAWSPYQSDNFKLMVHVGATSLKEAQDLADHAQSLNVNAIGCMAPIYLKPGKLSSLIQFCQLVAAKAEKLPFYYYHIPEITGVDFPMHSFLDKAKDRIPNLVGIKFSQQNMMRLHQCLAADEGRWDILFGADEALLSGLVIGIRGGIGSTYNYLAPVYHKMIEAFENSDFDQANELQLRSVNFVDILIRYGGGVRAGKPIMKMLGLDCGPLRSPGDNLSEKELLAYEKELRDLGFFDWIL